MYALYNVTACLCRHRFNSIAFVLCLLTDIPYVCAAPYWNIFVFDTNIGRINAFFLFFKGCFYCRMNVVIRYKNCRVLRNGELHQDDLKWLGLS